jgi:hypothetical protein
MNPTVDRLQALLSRVQKNAGLLAQSRADGSYYNESSSDSSEAPPQAPHEAAPAVSEVPPPPPPSEELALEEAEILDLDEAAELPPEQLSEQLEATSYQSLPPAPGPGESGELLASEPDLSTLDDDALEAELRVSETSGAWDDPNRQGESDEQSYSSDEESASTPRTPPPESGPQVSASPKSSMPPRDSVPADSHHPGMPKLEPQAPLPEFAEEGSLSSPSDQPSMEQLGSTVELEPATAGPLDMAAIEEPSAAGRGDDEYEEHLPRADRVGVYDESLAPPATAQDELHAYDLAEQERQARRSLMPEVAMSQPPDTIAAPPAHHVAEGADGVEPRSPVSPTTIGVTYEGMRPDSSRTFMQLLDDGLSLGSASD